MADFFPRSLERPPISGHDSAMTADAKRHLRSIPSVAALLDDPECRDLLARYPRHLVVDALRARLAELRDAGIAGDLSRDHLFASLRARLDALGEPAPRPVINASGVVLHTNLGRALLAEPAIAALTAAAAAPCALEMKLSDGSRGHRDDDCASQLVALTGAEAATVVNNNAAAVILAVNSLAEGREVVVSRGELIEIGGSFRIPEILAKSGVRLREVGTTNRTHLRDYADAIGPQTGLLLKVHPSNYAIGGFTARCLSPSSPSWGRRAASRWWRISAAAPSSTSRPTGCRPSRWWPTALPPAPTP
jgi:L-seryl-tRNA(Ser) seleniumtransferase